MADEATLGVFILGSSTLGISSDDLLTGQDPVVVLKFYSSYKTQLFIEADE